MTREGDIAAYSDRVVGELLQKVGPNLAFFMTDGVGVTALNYKKIYENLKIYGIMKIF